MQKHHVAFVPRSLVPILHIEALARIGRPLDLRQTAHAAVLHQEQLPVLPIAPVHLELGAPRIPGAHGHIQTGSLAAALALVSEVLRQSCKNTVWRLSPGVWCPSFTSRHLLGSAAHLICGKLLTPLFCTKNSCP